MSRLTIVLQIEPRRRGSSGTLTRGTTLIELTKNKDALPPGPPPARCLLPVPVALAAWHFHFSDGPNTSSTGLVTARSLEANGEELFTISFPSPRPDRTLSLAELVHHIQVCTKASASLQAPQRSTPMASAFHGPAPPIDGVRWTAGHPLVGIVVATHLTSSTADWSKATQAAAEAAVRSGTKVRKTTKPYHKVIIDAVSVGPTGSALAAAPTTSHCASSSRTSRTCPKARLPTPTHREVEFAPANL